ncbi:hypothetical protein HX833_03835 [Marine Group I thaumarchaeote]|uniref:Uncharacterized protein n=1 Tax=Marine Group I thaumarchaeote TaxID=2511932 RepID=A0A7K4NQ74_9ARCH|nr:hypothetical protein [Marine Group I thaumarchaeote]
MNSVPMLPKNGDFNPSLQNTVMEVKKLKEKLEQMLRDQNLPAGSAGVEIDDLTAVHSETNVKLGRLDELEKKEQSIKETEEKLDKAREAITKHEGELNSVKQSIGADIAELKEQDKIIKEAEYQKNYAKDEYNKLLENEKKLEENYEKFQESSIDDSFVDEEDAHYTKERVEQGEEDQARRKENQYDDYIDEGLENTAEEEAREAEEAALARGATLEEQHDAYETTKNDFYSKYSFGGEDMNVSFHTYVKSDLEDGEERINAAEELKDKAKDNITKRRAKITELEAQHDEISSNLGQAQQDYESARKIAANMKLERDQLKHDIMNGLIPLIEKINKLYGNFISAKKSNQVVEKSNKVKNELEELKKELSNTEDQVDEHKELVQHGKIKRLAIKISNIDQMLYDLTIRHDKILETLNETDDRNTSGLNLEEHVSMQLNLTQLVEERKRVRSFFIQRFNIPEIKLVKNSEKQRLNLEVDLAILRQKKKLISAYLKSEEAYYTFQQDPKKYEEDVMRNQALIIQKRPPDIDRLPPDALQYMTSTDVEPPTIQPDPVLVQEFSWISTLETEFIKLVANVFKDVNNWWTELVPSHVRKNARLRNDRSKDFSEWDKTQDFKLLGKLNFNAITQIFTDPKCWKYFSDIFPKPAEFQQDWLISIRSKLIDTAYCRTRVNHSHRLDDMSHEMLKGHYGFFIKCMDDFKKKKRLV